MFIIFNCIGTVSNARLVAATGLYRLFAFSIDWCPTRDFNARQIICCRDPRREQCSATRRRFVFAINMSAIAFTSQEDKLFIESVRKYPELYDYSHMQHFNLLVKEISQKIGKSG